jgi:diketogulonate reductase-like aldo/keto reductase
MPSPTVTVRGVTVPSLGYGTWQVEGEAAYEGVLDALELGYRHIDTAFMYGNEAEVGRGIADSPVAREDIWLTTKVWLGDAAPDDLRRSAERSLESLGVDQVDLLLLHWPNPDVPIADTVNAFVGLREEGLIREFGVSNFPSGLLREAVAAGPVFTNQVEYHAYLPQPEVLAVCEEHDILLTAYSPFAHGQLLDDPVLADIAADRGATPGQVALAWLLEQPRVCTIPKASSHERRQENLAALSLELSEGERERIGTLGARRLRTGDPDFAPVWD